VALHLEVATILTDLPHVIIHHPLTCADVRSHRRLDISIPHLAWVVLNHLSQDTAGVLRVPHHGLVALCPMILTTVALTVALLATAILAARLAVLRPRPRAAEASETIHLGMVGMPENLEEATGGLKIRSYLGSSDTFARSHFWIYSHFYQLLVPTPIYRLVLCSMTSTLFLMFNLSYWLLPPCLKLLPCLCCEPSLVDQ